MKNTSMNGCLGGVKGALAVCAAGLSLLACGGDKIISSSDTLVFMGDSITEFGKRRSHGYVNLVVKGLAANGINPKWEGVGIQGHKASDMLKRFDKDVVDKKPTVVTISAGVNDIHQNVPFEKYMADERAMVAKAKATGAKIVMLSPTTVGFGEADTDQLRQFVGGVKQIVQEEKLVYAPTYELFRAWMNDLDSPGVTRLNGNPLKMTCDSVHMTAVADRQLARAVLQSFGLDKDEMSAAEKAWNNDDTLVPLVRNDGNTEKFSVNLTAAEAQAVKGLSLKQILDRGIPSLAANPKMETEGAGASVVQTVDSASGHISFRAYDQLIIAARTLGITVEDAIKCAILRGARDKATLTPTAPVVQASGVSCGATTATFRATIASVGATAGSCDVFLRLGASADKLGKAKRIVVGESATFAYLLKGLQASKSYAYELTFVNNAAKAQKAVVKGTFKTLAKGSVLEPSGADDTAALQAAIDAAVPSKGTVNLAGGVFNLSGELMLTGGVSLVGQGHEKTTLHQEATHRVATLKDGARLEGVTVEGGKTRSNWHNGGGVFVQDGTVSKCRVWYNHAGLLGNNTHGGGVFLEKGSVDHTIIAHNRTGWSGAGGGLAVRAGKGPVTVDSCEVYGNVVNNGSGGGVAVVMNFTDVTIRDTKITGNSSSGTGGGFFTDSKKVKLTNCTVTGNKAGTGEAEIAGMVP